MACVFSSSGWAATLSTLPMVAKLRSCCRIAAPVGGSSAWPAPEEPASMVTPTAAQNGRFQRVSRTSTENLIGGSHDSTAYPTRRLLDDLIRPLQHRLRDGQAERLCGLQVDDQLVLCRLLHGQIARLGPFENLVHVGGGAPDLVVKVDRVGHEAAHLDKLPIAPHRR